MLSQDNNVRDITADLARINAVFAAQHARYGWIEKSLSYLFLAHASALLITCNAALTVNELSQYIVPPAKLFIMGASFGALAYILLNLWLDEISKWTVNAIAKMDDPNEVKEYFYKVSNRLNVYDRSVLFSSFGAISLSLLALVSGVTSSIMVISLHFKG